MSSSNSKHSIANLHIRTTSKIVFSIDRQTVLIMDKIKLFENDAANIAVGAAVVTGVAGAVIYLVCWRKKKR